MISKDESAHSTFTELITRKNRSPSPHFKCNGGTHIPLSALKDISNYSPTEVQVSFVSLKNIFLKMTSLNSKHIFLNFIGTCKIEWKTRNDNLTLYNKLK